MEFRKLPIYTITVNPDEDETGMTCISLVDYPAIEVNFLKFNKDLKFAVQDADQHIITGPAVIRDLPIYRRSYDMGEYYVVFDQQAIDNMILKYSNQGMWNNVSLQHDGKNIDGVTMVEFYKKDSEKGIVPKGFEDVTDGSLFVSYKVTDESLWDEIKNGNELQGFSIEINADLTPTEEYVEEEDIWDDEMDKELYDLLKEIFGDDIEVLFADEKKKFSKAGDLAKAVDDGTQVKIDVQGKEIKGFPYTLYERDGSSNVALWDGKSWHTINIKDIGSVENTGVKSTPDTWIKALGSPDYDWIEKILDDSENVNPTTSTSDPIVNSINNGSWVIINYNDEKENPRTGARQCVVMERGWTVRNNRAVRVWEQSGDSRHPEDIAGWRTMLIHRITNIRSVDWLDPITSAPVGFRPIGAGEDRDGFITDLRSPLQ